MNQRTQEILDYPRLREEIAGYCMSLEGKNHLLLREPSSDLYEIERLKNLGRMWLMGILAETAPPLKSWPPIRPFLPRLQVEGASLSLEDFYALALFCESVQSLRDWGEHRTRASASARQDSLSIVSFSDKQLVAASLSLPDLNEPKEAIFRIIDHSGELRDLPEIRSIRQAIQKIRQDIDRLVGRYLSDDSVRPMLQSTLPTLRDGRQVIALRSNFKGRIRGIVHEVSQSGQTVYVEPEDVVDRNNDLVTEEHRLSREVARILKELTATLSPFYAEILDALESMIFLDGIGAGARWGNANRCVYASEPQEDVRDSHNESVIQIRQARHPLLRPHAVPIDLVLSPGGRMLIITGPNTGGKTVTLKTVALFALLNQSGWPVPAADPTVLPIFDYIGCDIGDEQSLDQSLSTFSAHMKNISSMLCHATEKSLVLLDELGSGTDPQEGSAIAMAVLDELLQKKTVVLVTTHHGILKNYGYTHESCINASVDFDQDTLSPTYRILMGVPGESHALDIAEKNGLEKSIVARARTYLIEERADVSALIRGLTAKHEELDRFEHDKKIEESTLREKRRKADLRELQLRQKEIELRDKGYRRLDSLLDESRKKLENLVREIREGELNRDKTLQVKAFLTDLERTVSGEQDSLREEKQETARTHKEIGEKHRKEAEADARSGKISKDEGKRQRKKRLGSALANESQPLGTIPEFAIGVEVYVGAQKRRGTLIREEKKGHWVVATGTIRMTISASELTAVPVNSVAKPLSVEIQTDMTGDDTPAFELRLLGMRHDEAMKALSRQLDLASMKGLLEFSVVHGKGEGILQSAVHQMLGTYASVSEFHFARPEEGGTGKTIVRLGQDFL